MMPARLTGAFILAISLARIWQTFKSTGAGEKVEMTFISSTPDSNLRGKDTPPWSYFDSFCGVNISFSVAKLR